MIITIDGPAGAGKSTMAKLLSEFFDMNCLDTGAIYRTVAYVAKAEGVDWNNEEELGEVCLDLSCVAEESFFYRNKKLCCYYNGKILTDEIRTSEISEGASIVSSVRSVREGLISIQRSLASNGIVAEGRDMGTTVFPGADVKIYLDGNIVDRAQRRSLQTGADFSVMCRAIESRDQRDSNREFSPLKKTHQHLVVDSTDKSIYDVLAEMIKAVKDEVGDVNIGTKNIDRVSQTLAELDHKNDKYALQKQLRTDFVV